MFDSFDLNNEDTHNLGWIVGETYYTRAYSNYPSLFDTVLGYHGAHVVVLRKQEGTNDRIVQHLTPLHYSKFTLQK